MLKKLTIIFLVLRIYVLAQESTEINSGQKLEREITTSEKHTYKFTVPANQFVNIAVEQKGIDILLKLISPEGTTIAEYDSPTGRTGTEETKAVLEKEGVYFLEISVVERTKVTGKYELSFAEKREATTQDLTRFRAIIAYQAGMNLRGQRTIPALKQAVLKFEEAAGLMGELGDKKEQGIATAEKGLSQQLMGEYDNAIASYKAAIPLYDQVKDYKNKGTALNNIAFIKSRLAEYQEALFYLHQSLETSRLSENQTAPVLPLINLANVYKAVGDLRRSIEYYNEALVLAKKFQMKSSETAILMNLGLIYSDIGEHQKGLDMHLEILPYYKSVRDNGGELNTIGYIADEYFYLGNYNESLNYFNQQLKLGETANSRNTLTYAYFGLGKNYTKLGDSAKALETLEKSLSYVAE
ncbi:MAG TPA: tetratricopeptide repeat protein, partial [Pyrinomonadaceae bacterium]|nr:tetratricopeptide repeat protein [Pyrinomonadaceae bacterium]